MSRESLGHVLVDMLAAPFIYIGFTVRLLFLGLLGICFNVPTEEIPFTLFLTEDPVNGMYMIFWCLIAVAINTTALHVNAMMSSRQEPESAQAAAFPRKSKDK